MRPAVLCVALLVACGPSTPQDGAPLPSDPTFEELQAHAGRVVRLTAADDSMHLYLWLHPDGARIERADGGGAPSARTLVTEHGVTAESGEDLIIEGGAPEPGARYAIRLRERDAQVAIVHGAGDDASVQRTRLFRIDLKK